jgi:WD40 repeat protein
MADLPQDCLENLGKQHSLSSSQMKVFLARINSTATDREVADSLGMNHGAFRTTMVEVYKKFLLSGSRGRGKLEELREFVNSKCGIKLSASIRTDLSEMPPVHVFCGREQEQKQLENWITRFNQQLIFLHGMKGIGKTALAVKLLENVREEFESIVWRDLRGISSFDGILEGLIKFLSNDPNDSFALRFKEKWLLNYFRQHRCLLILDDVTFLLQHPEECKKCCEFLRQIAEYKHSSCVVLTGSQLPRNFIDNDQTYYRSYGLKGLDVENAKQLLQSQEDPLFVSPIGKNIEENAQHEVAVWKEFVNHFGGNPKALKIAASQIRRLLDGDILKFLESKTMYGSPSPQEAVEDLLDEQSKTLSQPEEQLMYSLAIAQEPLTIKDLKDNIIPNDVRRSCENAVDQLLQKSLIEKSHIERHQGAFTQVPMIMDYFTDRLIDKICEELDSGNLQFLNSHALLQAQAKDFIREKQIWRILEPIAERLLQAFNGNRNAIKSRLEHLLSVWRNQQPDSGYVAGNIINISRQLKLDLSNLDFSNVPVWQAYLQGIDLKGVSFINSDLLKSTFSEALSPIHSVTFSADGSHFATGEANGDIRIWKENDLTSKRIRGHNSQVWSVAFSADGEILASGSEDSVARVKLWNVATGKLHSSLPVSARQSQCVRSVAFSPNGTLLAAAGDTCIEVWDWKTETLLNSIPCTGVYSVTFTSNSILASGSQDGAVILWNLSNNNHIQRWQEHSETVRCIAFSSNQNLLASGSEDGTVRLWEIDRSNSFSCLHGEARQVWAIAFSQDGKTLASGGVELNAQGSEIHIIRLWDIDTGKSHPVLTGHTKQLRSLAFSPDSRKNTLLISGGDDCSIKLWHINTGKCHRTIQGYTNRIWSISLDTNAQLLASGSEDNKIHFWNSTTGEFIKTFTGHTNWVWSVAFSPDGETLASSSEDNEIRLWNVITGEFRVLRRHTDRVRLITFSPDGRLLASGSNDRNVIIWDVSSGEPYRILSEDMGGHQSRVLSVAFNHDSSLLASSSRDTTIRVWDVHNSELFPKKLEGHGGQVHSISFVETGGALISGSFDTSLRLWDIETGRTIHEFLGHTAGVLSVCSHPNSSIVASGGHDQTIRLWDIETGRCLSILRGHEGPIEAIAFDREGQTLYSCSQDQTIKSWDIQSETCINTSIPEKPYKGMKLFGAKNLSVPVNILWQLGASRS